LENKKNVFSQILFLPFCHSITLVDHGCQKIFGGIAGNFSRQSPVAGNSYKLGDRNLVSMKPEKQKIRPGKKGGEIQIHIDCYSKMPKLTRERDKKT